MATRVAAPAFGAATLTSTRIVVAALLGLATLRLMRDRRPLSRRQLPGLLALGAGIGLVYPFCLALAVERVPASHAAVVLALLPAATALAAVVRSGERPPWPFWLACGVGFVAVTAYAVDQGGGSVRSADLLLVVAVVSCAIGYAEGARVAREIGAVARRGRRDHRRGRNLRPSGAEEIIRDAGCGRAKRWGRDEAAE